MGVVLAVVGDPVEHAALERHRAGDREAVLDGLRRLEGAMREQTVVAHRDAQPVDDVQPREDAQVDPVDPVVPQEEDGGDQADERHDHPGHVRVALSPGHALQTGVLLDTILVDLGADSPPEFVRKL